MRCLHCGNRISLLRKLKDSEFCSDEHRDFHALQQQQLAVGRLMETSSPKHKQLPELQRPPKEERVLPPAPDRRAIEAAEKDLPPSPPPAPAAAVPAQPVVLPVHRNSVRMYGFVPEPAPGRDWEPWTRRCVDAVDEPFQPVLATPTLERPVRKRPLHGRTLPFTGTYEWARAGRFQAVPFCEPPAAPSSASTFSEILSLSLHGFVCDRVLTVDTTPYVPPVPEPERLPVRPFEMHLPASAEAALGSRQLPQTRNDTLATRCVEASPEAPGISVTLIRPEWELRSKLPEIDWTVERLDRAAARHEPGLLRLRSPRVRIPLLARLVKPAAGNSGPPIRVRPRVRPPKTSPCVISGFAMPVGRKLPLSFDRPVQGNTARIDFCEEAQAFQTEARCATRPSARWNPGMALGGLVPLAVEPATGLALTEGASAELAGGVPGLALPGASFIRGADFDPPSCGLVRLSLKVEPRRRSRATLAIPALRPVISYRWVPVKPELEVRTMADWGATPITLAPLTLGATAPSPQGAPAPSGAEPVEPVVSASFVSVRLPAKQSARSGAPPLAGRMLPVSLDECTPKSGKETPITRLDNIAPKPGHQLRKSKLKTQADWQRSKWTSASAYGSALWRIAIGRFSGALGDAPKAIRWLAAVAALGLGAFALLPGDGPAAPKDTGWTIANHPAVPAAQAPTPPPRPVRVAPPPPRLTHVRTSRASRVQQPAGGGQAGPGISLTGAWDNFQRRLSERAAVAFTDDFRNGLADWEGAGEWARSWSYDASGFVRTGAMALLAPARDLTDYRMEFLGQIERRSMGWVVRAADMRNYYALKLTIVADGPQPEVALIRYPVINGVAGPASQQLLPLDVRTDTVYRVQTEVRDDYYAVIVQGKVVDSWTDGRLKRGSIGLFSGKGELARVRWVGVWHQYDTLGRLCALLAPSGLPGRERGANQ
jgi:hypothetical protein